MKLFSAMVAATGDGKAACRAFKDAGFEVGPLVGETFSITAPRPRFEQLFGKGFENQAPPAILPIDRLPANLRRHVSVVTFSAPLDFGPTDY